MLTLEARGGTQADMEHMQQEHPQVEEEGDAPPAAAPAPPMRPRRRFVKPGLTTYELSFSRRHALARRNRRGYAGSAEAEAARAADVRPEQKPQTAEPAQEPSASPTGAAAMSSLSSVLNEVMNGRSRALSNFVDATAPAARPTGYEVRRDADGTPYVAAADGQKHFADSAIGRVFLTPAPRTAARSGASAAERRSDLDFMQARGPSRQQQQRRSMLSSSSSDVDDVDDVDLDDVDVDDVGQDQHKHKRLLRGLGMFHKARRGRGQRKAKRLGRATPALPEEPERALVGDHMAVLGSAGVSTSTASPTEELPMLDPARVDRSRGDSSWEVPPAKASATAEARELTAMEMLDADDKADVRLAAVEPLARSNGSSSSSSGSGTAPHVLPRLQPRKDPLSPPLRPQEDAYDEDDNPLCMSFQNVRDVDFLATRKSDEEEEDEEEDAAAAASAVSAAAPDAPDVDAVDFAGRVRVSSNATNVAEFVGGFKSRSGRRAGAGGFASRKRSVRHARQSLASQAATELARKLLEARNRVPLEFRDEYLSASEQLQLQKKRKKKWRASGKHVRFDMNVRCREFEVESEDEDDGDESPDEIVDAVQLVHAKDALHAEDVVPSYASTSPSAVTAAASTGDSLGSGGREDDDPLTFSQLGNDKPLAFSDL